jgi:iron(III) transport system substrate-binding protein
MSERRADKNLADLYLNGMTTGYNVFYKAKVLDPIPPQLILPEVTDASKWWRGRHQYVDPENQYLLNFNGENRMVVAFNTKLVNPAEIKSYWDLLNPKWKGKIVAYDPTQGGSGDATRFFYHHKSLGREFIRRILSETDIVISRDTRQMGDWLAGGKYAISIFGPVSRMDLDLMQTQGLPVDWFKPDHLKEGTYITGGSGGVALINKAPHPNATKVGLNWLLSREGQIAYQRLFTQGNDGPIPCASTFPKIKCRAAIGVPRVTTDVPLSSIAPSGWIRSRSPSSSKKCWNNGRIDGGFAILDCRSTPMKIGPVTLCL